MLYCRRAFLIFSKKERLQNLSLNFKGVEVKGQSIKLNRELRVILGAILSENNAVSIGTVASIMTDRGASKRAMTNG